ncbi:uncharacterized protein APUU_21262A [Aspergillus puulaauensis]|uniref:Peptidase A1 domain-containing protein n=1 Tax=Aspergillus puulaauensis TaxID=1220207 RepID=A0A7R8AKL4_9EURO|nr:uncharacterized protein APUU_21262A [Aspergillus puulaauensis]BCS20830.1 hypothetical protein APUU_21262A [Aspergillus puulaauensis]
MVLSCYLGLWTAAFLSASAEQLIPVVKRDNPAVITAKVQAAPSSGIPALQARDTISGLASKPSGGYWLNVTIGTPPQPVALLVDAQGTDVEVMYPGPDNADCSDFRYCGLYGQFIPQDSSSFSSDDEEWQSTFSAPHGFDTIGVDGSKATNISLQLVPIDNPSSYSSLGVGPDNTSFPYQLVDRGLINTPSFSAWRDHVSDEDVEQDPKNSSSGGIIFGGINAAKFNGPLHSFSFKDSLSDEFLSAMTVPVHGVQVHVDPASTANSTAGAPINSTFDETLFDIQTRYVTTYLPLDAAMAVYDALNITRPTKSNGRYPTPELPCHRSSENHTITFLIGSAAFDIPWTAFITPANIPSEGNCLSQIDIPDGHGTGLTGSLGSTLLSHLYLAVDYNSMMVGLAPINRTPGEDEILEIGTEAPQLPGGVGDFPESVTAYTPTPTGSVATETSDGWAVMQTAPGLFAVGGAVLVGLI